MKVILPDRSRFSAILHECRSHSKRLRSAREKCAAFFPLDAPTYQSLSDSEVEHVDQLVYRFTKLQDALGAKLFPAIVSVLREDTAAMTVFDVLSELEAVGVIESADAWARLREIRNQLAHDYQDDPEEGSRQLNHVYASIGVVLRAEHSATAFVEQRVLPSLPREDSGDR